MIRSPATPAARPRLSEGGWRVVRLVAALAAFLTAGPGLAALMPQHQSPIGGLEVIVISGAVAALVAWRLGPRVRSARTATATRPLRGDLFSLLAVGLFVLLAVITSRLGSQGPTYHESSIPCPAGVVGPCENR